MAMRHLAPSVAPAEELEADLVTVAQTVGGRQPILLVAYCENMFMVFASEQ
jgi:hypothetical protein